MINDRGSFTSNRSILPLGVINPLCIRYGVISTDPIKADICYEVLILCQHNGGEAKYSSPHSGLASDLCLKSFKYQNGCRVKSDFKLP